MNEEQITKLNHYLNDCFLALEEKNAYLLENLRKIIVASESYAHFAKNLKQEETIQTHLSFEEVYVLGREFIEATCPCYLEEYDAILSNGILDFSYENEYDESHVHFNYARQQFEINLNRQFNYRDVVTLIHEFMHYTNNKKKNDKSNHLLAEFISIYFETKAILYFINEKEISPNEISWNKRFMMTKGQAKTFNWYSFPFMMYQMFGEIKLDYLDALCTYLSPYKTDETQFSEECNLLLQRFEKLENDYHENCDKIDQNPENWRDYILKNAPFQYNYRYLLGTILAFFALEHCDTKDMTELNNHIRDYTYDVSKELEDTEYYYGVENLLYTVGIDINQIGTLEASIESMQHFIDTCQETKRK